MRILLAFLILLSTTLLVSDAKAQTNDPNVYIVKRGEVWDWSDVLSRSSHYRGRAGIGLPDFIAGLNGNPRLAPGTAIRVAPLEEMLAETPILKTGPAHRSYSRPVTSLSRVSARHVAEGA